MKSFPSGLISRQLDNGLRFVARSLPSLPVTSTMIWYRVGSADEKPGKTGIAHFLEHMMFKGTGSLRQGQIDRITQKHGGVNNAFTWLDATAYYFNFGQDRWQIALDIEAERMQRCLIDSREFALEKAVVLEERSMDMDSPEGMLLEEVNRTAFSAHPYGQPIIGWMEDLEALQPEDLWSFYEQHYTPDRAHIVMVGDFDVEQAFRKVQDVFGAIQPSKAAFTRRPIEPPQRGERRVLLERQCEAPQLSLAYHVPPANHPDTAALTLLDTVLTTGRTSRLHHRLVDQEKLAISVDSGSYDTMDPYLFFINTELHTGGRPERVEEILYEELERLADRGPTAVELAKAKKLFEADWVLDHQTAEDQAVQIGEALCWGDLDALAQLPGRVEAVSKRDVQRVAQHYFQKTNRTVGHLVPLKDNPTVLSLRPPVAPVAEGTRRGRNVETRAWKTQSAGRKLSDLHLDITRSVLPNGLTLLCIPDPSVPSVYAELQVASGSRYEAETQAGRSALLGRMLSEGTTTRTAQQLATLAEEIGAKFETSGGYRHTRMAVEVLRSDLALGLDLLADVARNSVFPQSNLQDRKQEQLSFIARLEDDPQRLGQRWFNELVFKGHPLHRPALGYAKTVSELQREMLVEEYRRSFVPGAAVLALAGDLDGLESVRRQVEDHFGNWAPAPLPDTPEPDSPKRQKSRRTKLIHKAKEQVHLFVGHLGLRRKDPRFEAAVVLDNVLGQGGGLTDRLSQRLREREGLAYSVHASLSRTAGIDPGQFQAYIGTSPESAAQALRGIREEIRRIREEPVPVRELTPAKSYILGQYPFGFQTNRDLVGYAQMCQQFGWDFGYYRRFLEAIEAIGPEQVQTVARECLDPDALTVVAVGPLRGLDLGLDEG